MRVALLYRMAEGLYGCRFLRIISGSVSEVIAAGSAENVIKINGCIFIK